MGKREDFGKYTIPCINKRSLEVEVVLEGQWKYDKMLGHGKHTNSKGDVYEGAWNTGSKEGREYTLGRVGQFMKVCGRIIGKKDEDKKRMPMDQSMKENGNELNKGQENMG
jgi:hypothetical protein